MSEDSKTDEVGAFPAAACSTIGARAMLAALCPKDELDEMMPQTVGKLSDELIRRNIIPRRNSDRVQRYTDADRLRLRCLLRYEWADAMLSVSNSGGEV